MPRWWSLVLERARSMIIPTCLLVIWLFADISKQGNVVVRQELRWSIPIPERQSPSLKSRGFRSRQLQVVNVTPRLREVQQFSDSCLIFCRSIHFWNEHYLSVRCSCYTQMSLDKPATETLQGNPWHARSIAVLVQLTEKSDRKQMNHKMAYAKHLGHVFNVSKDGFTVDVMMSFHHRDGSDHKIQSTIDIAKSFRILAMMWTARETR